jgi:hypothetical protein
MTPIWISPAYPLLLSAPFASNLIDALPGVVAASRINAIAISLGAITLQGTGFPVSLNIWSLYIPAHDTETASRRPQAQHGQFSLRFLIRNSLTACSSYQLAQVGSQLPALPISEMFFFQRYCQPGLWALEMMQHFSSWY